MNAPDKIYIQQDMINNIPLEQKEFDDDVEFIRKDTILEWAKEMNESCNGSILSAAYATMINKIQSL